MRWGLADENRRSGKIDRACRSSLTQNLDFNGFPVIGSQLYASPTLSGLGVTNKTIGSPRQIQMSLRLAF